LTAFKKLSTFDNARSRFSTWLFTIARNKSINAIRAQSRRRRIESQYQPPKNPDEKNNEDLFRQLDAALETIPRKQKTAFVMAHFEDMPYAEIAQIEGISIGTVRSRVFRAKKKIAAAIKRDGDK
jgi:RNA polymerase sigma-70 factor (ECF subfamily)